MSGDTIHIIELCNNNIAKITYYPWIIFQGANISEEFILLCHILPQYRQILLFTMVLRCDTAASCRSVVRIIVAKSKIQDHDANSFSLVLRLLSKVQICSNCCRINNCNQNDILKYMGKIILLQMYRDRQCSSYFYCCGATLSFTDWQALATASPVCTHNHGYRHHEYISKYHHHERKNPSQIQTMTSRVSDFYYTQTLTPPKSQQWPRKNVTLTNSSEHTECISSTSQRRFKEVKMCSDSANLRKPKKELNPPQVKAIRNVQTLKLSDEDQCPGRFWIFPS